MTTEGVQIVMAGEITKLSKRDLYQHSCVFYTFMHVFTAVCNAEDYYFMLQ